MKSLKEKYAQIESLIPTIEELLLVGVKECGDPIVELEETQNLQRSFHNMDTLTPIIGRRMLVRSEVADRLMQASIELSRQDQDLALQVFYAYRPREIQEQLFASACEVVSSKYPDFTPFKQRLFAHVLAADPEVAGHPTGGAVDLTLFNKKTNRRVDMGVSVKREAFRAAGQKIYTFSPEISDAQISNRKALRSLMEMFGFQPFEGEFWHFSYGDREWAFGQQQKTGTEVKAIYAPVNFEEIRLSL